MTWHERMDSDKHMHHYFHMNVCRCMDLLYVLLITCCVSLVISEKARFHDLDKHGGSGDQMEIMKALTKRSEIRRREEKKAQRMYEYQNKKGRFVSSCYLFL